jgi:hypothetical protein
MQSLVAWRIHVYISFIEGSLMSIERFSPDALPKNPNVLAIFSHMDDEGLALHSLRCLC